MAEPKELHFFSVAENWQRGRRWYEECFTGAGSALARGEVSPSYSQADIFPGVADRIAAMLPEIRLVYVVRHPIERMRSMYLHQLASGRERRPIAQAFEVSQYYLNSSRYAWQLDFYLEHFPTSRVKVVTTDALRDDPTRTLAELHRFIGVDDSTAPSETIERGRTEDKRVPTALKSKVSGWPGYSSLKRLIPSRLSTILRSATTRPVSSSRAELPADVEAELVEQLRPDLERLRSFLGTDFDGWGLLDVATTGQSAGDGTAP
jgi:hypothetical protein